MSDELSEKQVRELLRRRCVEAGSQKAWADTHGFSPAYVSDILHENRDPSEAIANALGLIRKTTFKPLNQECRA